MKNFSFLISHLSSQKGYTLIELLIVFSIMALIGGLGIVSFINFNNSQVVDGAASDVASSYTIARQRALSQIKPTQCTSPQTLRGYEVTLNIGARTYQVSAVCTTTRVIVTTKTLPPLVTFDSNSPTTVLFRVPNATVSAPGTVTIRGFGKTKTITIDTTGTISVM